MTVHDLLALQPRAPDVRDREILLAHILRKERTWVLAHPESRVHHARAARYRRLLTRLRRDEPLAHVIGEQWFYGRPFRVTRDTLIPRPETELLVNLARATLLTPIPAFHDREKRGYSPALIDVGTGSGCIGVTLAAELPKVHVIATDVSRAALRVARLNANRHGVATRITFLRGNLLEPLITTRHRIRKANDTVFDGRQKLCRSNPVVIVANLPYLTTAEWRALPRSIRVHEPRQALDGGPDGLEPYRALFRQLSDLTSHVSCLTSLLEIDPRRRAALARLVRTMLPGWHTTWHRDLAGHWRVLDLSQGD